MSANADPYGPQPPHIDPADLPGWLIEVDDDFIAVNKPGWVVCHPSKDGPWSSLVGACREHFGAEVLHLVSRLDRETSGIILLARNRAAARVSQMAMQDRKVGKTYNAILHGELAGEVWVDQPLAKDHGSPVHSKVVVREDRTAQQAQTWFRPLAVHDGWTLAEIRPITGRKHQIRAHAEWLGHPVAGDKLYSGDPTLYLEFVEHGWTPRMAASLPLRRQALHAARLEFKAPKFDRTFAAPWQADFAALAHKLGLAAG